MGLFAKIKELFSAKRLILRAIEEQEQKYTALSNLPKEELLTVSDEDLIGTINFLCDRDIQAHHAKPWNIPPLDRIGVLSPERQTVFVLSWYDDQIRNGGLFEFFCSEERVFAPLVETFLLSVNALEHHNLFRSFLDENALDATDLSAFAVENAAVSNVWEKRYPFQAYYQAYASLPPLESYLAAYIRDRIDDLI